MKPRELKLWLKSQGALPILIWLYQGLLLPLLLISMKKSLEADQFLGWSIAILQGTLPLTITLPLLSLLRPLTDASSLEMLRAFLPRNYRQGLMRWGCLFFGLLPSLGLIFFGLGLNLPPSLIIHVFLSCIWIAWLSYLASSWLQKSELGVFGAIFYVLLNVFMGSHFPIFPTFYVDDVPSWGALLLGHSLFTLLCIGLGLKTKKRAI